MRGLVTYVRADGRIIELKLRTEDGNVVIKRVTDFYPYFYVPNSSGEYVSVFGERLMKVRCEDPRDVRHKRENYEKHYEADIPYTRRFLIDTGIKQGAEVPDTIEISWRDIKPVQVKVEPRIWWFDIEVYQEGGLPDARNPEQEITAFTVYDTYINKYVTVVVAPVEGIDNNADDWIVIKVKSERDLIDVLRRMWENAMPDIVVGWNIYFDVDYVRARTKRLGVPFGFDYADIYDYYGAYRSMFQRRSYRLKDVAVYEKIITKEEVVEARELNDLWRYKIDEFVAYNKRDVFILVELEKKHGILKFKHDLKTFAGVAHISDVDGLSVLVDTLLLRLAKDLGVVLPSVQEHKNKGYEGAHVFDVRAGIYEDVAQYDMSRYYPSLVISFNLSPETFGKDTEELGIMPRLCKMLIDKRNAIEAEMKKYEPGTEEYNTLKAQVTVVKFATNAVYGYMAYSKSRMFNVDIAATITRLAREGILAVARAAEERGYKVIYGDTDSIFIQIPFEQAEALMHELNEEIKKYFTKMYGVKNINVKLKFEKYNKRILFTDAKKRYAAWVVWDKGQKCDYVHIAGFEAVRTDQSEFTADIQRRLLEMIVRGASKEEIISFVNKLHDEFMKQPLNKIAIAKGINKPLDEFKSKQAHVRGALLANMYLGANIKHGDKVKMLYVKYVEGVPSTDVICFEDVEQLKGRKVVVDWEKMYEKTVLNKIKEILRAVGIGNMVNHNVAQKNLFILMLRGGER